MHLSCGFENRKARVEMLPLIDVVFLLMVFFIYAMLSMVVHRGIAVNLPAAMTGHVEQIDYVAVSISNDNLLLVNRQPVTLDELAESVLTLLEATGDKAQVFLECDEKAEAGLAIRALDRLRAAGIKDVLFASREMP